MQLLRVCRGWKQTEGNAGAWNLQTLERRHGEDDWREEDEHQGYAGVLPAVGGLAEGGEQEERSHCGLGTD